MAEGRSFWVYFKGDLRDLQTKAKSAKQTMRQAQRDIQATAQNLGRAMTVVGGSIVATLGAATKGAADFQTGMRKIATLGVGDMEAMEATVRRLGQMYGVDLQDTLLSGYDILSAHSEATGAEVDRAMDIIAQAAVSGQTSVRESMKIGLDLVDAFGTGLGGLEEAFDAIYVAIGKGKTELQPLSQGVGRLAPTFAAAGLSADEMLAAIAALTAGGIETSEAVTGLKAAMSNIIRPSIQAQHAAKALELDFSAAALRAKGFGGFMDDLGRAVRERGPEMAELRASLGDQIEEMQNAAGGTEKYKEQIMNLRKEHASLQGVSDDQLTTMAALFGSIEGLNAILALSGSQAGKLSETLDAMSDKTGTLQKAFEAFTEDNFWYNLKVLGGQLMDIGITIGNALLPTITGLVEHLGGITKWIGDFACEYPKIMNWIATIMAGLGALMVTLGPLLYFLPGIVQGFASFREVLGLLQKTKIIGWMAKVIGVPGVGLVGISGALLAIAGAGAAGWMFGRWLDNISSNTALGRWIDDQTKRIYDMYKSLRNLLGILADPTEGIFTPEEIAEINRQNREARGQGAERGVSGEYRSRDLASIATSLSSRGSGIAQAAATAPAMATAGAGGGGLNLSVSFGDVQVREQADINRLADAISRRAYDRLVLRGIRR